jgi:hypothetical protein
MKHFNFVLVFLAALLFFPAAGRSQTSEGGVLGEVRDSSGAAVAGAIVTVTETAQGVSRTTLTNADGEFAMHQLEPGSYTVAATARGFKRAEASAVQVEVSRAVRVDLRLDPGAVNETVEVKDEAPLTDTGDTTLNGVLTNKAINDLPLQGRDFQNLLPLHPGVQRTPGGGFHSVTSNGNRPDDNNFFIDGADDNDAYYGETVVNDAGISGTPSSHLPLDSIQEFNTQEGPDANYGVKPGVVMNIGLKSGNNGLHGSAYYFHRNSALDARNFYAPAPDPVPALLLHQFGASLGGPIQKDKWFYFVNYEGVRDKVGNPGNVDSPVTTSLVGRLDPSIGAPEDYSIFDALAQCKANGNCSPTSVSLAKYFYPNPGFTASATDPALIDFDFNNRNREENLVAKTDYVLNAQNTFSARFIYANTTEVEEDAEPIAPEFLSTASPITQVFGVGWVWTPNARWVNEARFSYNRFNEAIAPVDHNVNPTTYGINTGVTDPRLFGMPRINPSDGLMNYLGGNSSWPLDTTPSGTQSVSDTVSYTKGRHTIQFGGSFRRGNVDYYRAQYGRGRVDWDSLEDFVDGNTDGVDEWRLLYGNPHRDLSIKSFGMFLQDAYRIKPRMILNLGLRYDITFPIKDAHNQLANFIPSEGIVQVGDGISQPYPTRYNNVSPRVGVAWDIFGTGRTVLRVAGGLIFDQPSIRTFAFNGGGLNLNPSGIPGVTPGNGSITSFLVESFDGTQLGWDGGGPVFPQAAGQQCKRSSPCDVFGVAPNLTTPYVANWNFNIQQALTPTTLLQVAYVANHGFNLYSVTDPNQADPTASANCILATGVAAGYPGASAIYGGDYSDCEQAAKPFTTNCASGTGPCLPYVGFESLLANKGYSDYNSLQVTFTKRYAHGLYLLAGYTWGHAIDTSTNNVASASGVFPQDSRNYAGNRGNGDFDIRNRFTIALTYDLPSIKGHWQMLDGWQIATVAMLEAGEPYTLLDGVDDVSATGELVDRWNIGGPAKNVHWSPNTPLDYISWDTFSLDGNGNVNGGNAQCIAAAGPNNQLALNMLGNYGCYIAGSTVLTPPALGTFGNMGRNIFRGPGFRNWDLSIIKNFKLNDHFRMQLRGEFYNVLNHPNFDDLTLNNDLSGTDSVGTTAYTPDVGESNPVIGSGGSRHVQVGLKLIW